VNWNGWKEQDEGKAPPGDYVVQLKDSVGDNIGTPITVNIVRQIISLAENWNLISFTVNQCFYEGILPAVFIPEGVEKVNISDLGFTYMADWFSSILTPNIDICETPWRVVQSALPGGGEYGLLSIYGNDITTSQIDGAQMNDELTVKVDGHPMSQPIRWLGNHEIQQVDLVIQTYH